jgi:peroxiredoxin
MAIGTMDTLRIGELFPTLQARAADGSTLRIPDELHDRVAVLLFYRGHW